MVVGVCGFISLIFSASVVPCRVEWLLLLSWLCRGEKVSSGSGVGGGFSGSGGRSQREGPWRGLRQERGLVRLRRKNRKKGGILLSLIG